MKIKIYLKIKKEKKRSTPSFFLRPSASHPGPVPRHWVWTEGQAVFFCVAFFYSLKKKNNNIWIKKKGRGTTSNVRYKYD
jgi:hypothetical protein